MLWFSFILCWFKLYFPLFRGMVMYGNDFKTKKNKFKPRIKLNQNISTSILLQGIRLPCH